MKLIAFSVYDEKAEAFITPFFLPKTGMATREFQRACNDKTHQFGQNPHDYTLFQVGTYDIDTGELEADKHPVGNGIQYVKIELTENQRGLFGAIESNDEETFNKLSKSLNDTIGLKGDDQ